MMEIDDSQLVLNIRELISDSLQIPIDEIPEEMAFGDLPQWDSLGHMEVMLNLEEKYGVEINAETIAGLISIPEIVKYLKDNGYA